jgi:hypothetical protein
MGSLMRAISALLAQASREFCSGSSDSRLSARTRSRIPFGVGLVW